MEAKTPIKDEEAKEQASKDTPKPEPAKAIEKGEQVTTFSPDDSATFVAKDDEKESEKAKIEEEVDKIEEVFELKDGPRTWIIGKPPDHGGKENQYSIYTQKPLGLMPRMRFFGLLTNTISEAVKAGGAVDLGMGDVFGAQGGSIRERFQTLSNQDFADAGSFLALAFKLMAYAPDFLLDSFVIWLDVPPEDRRWAKQVMDQRYDPEDEKWGLQEDQFIEMVEIFIDQNYEEVRNFFAQKIPKFIARVQQREAARASNSEQSK